MAECKTKYFGQMQYGEEEIIRFPKGLPGFTAETAFLIVQTPEQYPLVYLQSEFSPELCFAALPLRAIDGGYQLHLSDEDSALLGVPPEPDLGTDVLGLALITTSSGDAYANLMGPVLIHVRARTGAQCINQAGDYTCREQLTTVEAGAAA